MTPIRNVESSDLSRPVIHEPALRAPSEMMSEARVTAAINNALSFARTGMRELVKGRWKVIRDRFDLDAEGRGEVLYRLTNEDLEFHFYLLSNKLPEEQKLDRNFAGTWEAMGVLCEGDWTPEREANLRAEIPKQVAGRSDYDTLTYVRGNRSGRLLQYVVDCLAEGRQPDAQKIASVGYILRTTAFIANGQLGTRPLAGYDPDHPMRRPYHAQIWSAFLLREYVFDLVEHMARAINPDAARLSPEIRRYVGLGNSAATGLVPFIANHPLMIHNWVQAQESAMTQARFRHVPVSSTEIKHLSAVLDKAVQYFEEHDAAPCGFFVPSRQMAKELSQLRPLIAEYQTTGTLAGQTTAQPWLALHQHLNTVASSDTVEVFNAILLELYPEITDQYIDAFLADEKAAIDPRMTAGELKAILEKHYGWVLDDLSSAESEYYFWYRAEAAPFDLRRGVKGVAPELERETPMDTLRLARSLLAELEQHSADAPILNVLMLRPDLRYVIRRVQNIARAPYGELRINLLKKSFSPFGPVRFVLSFYGMEKFEGANPKVVRGAFLQGAPIAEDVEQGIDGSWPFPLIPRLENTTVPQDRLESPQISIAPRPNINSDAQSSDIVTAPVELRRFIQTSLHGAGLELGVAEDMSGVVLFHEAIYGSRDSFLPQMLERRFPMAGQQPHIGIDGRILAVDARGASTLQVACHALDWVICRTPEDGDGSSMALVRDTQDVRILDLLVQRCADAGLLGILLWSTPDTFGVAVSAPGSQGNWMLRSHWGHCNDVVTSSNDPANMLMAAFSCLASGTGANEAIQSMQTWSVSTWAEALSDLLSTGPGISGTCASEQHQGERFALFGVRPEPADSAYLADRLTTLSTRTASSRAPTAVQMFTEVTLRDAEWERQRRGIRVDRQVFNALFKSTRNTLVPDVEEHHLRPGEVIDPLKIF